MQRLDKEMANRGLTNSRSQAENLIELGHVRVNKQIIIKPAHLVTGDDKITLDVSKQFVSRAALKLKAASEKMDVNFKGKVILDVGSSTGGFTEYALKQGAIKSVAVEVGTNQLHPSLRGDERIDLHEKTDIRSLSADLTKDVDIAVADVSFISLRQVLPSVNKLLSKPDALVIAMVKPQFEAGEALKMRGVIKNDTVRRRILKDFETWAKRSYIILDKTDSDVSGKKGNTERFYKLKPIR